MILFHRIAIFSLALTLLAPALLAGPDYHGVKVIAHRGAGFEFDENTVEGCKQSYERGIRGYEVDVRLTKDGQMILMHDNDVSRTTDGTGKVEELTLAEMRKLRTKSGVGVPTIEDLFTFFKDKPDVYLMLEMKTTETKAYPDAAIEPYCRQLHDTAKRMLPPGTFCFISFDTRALGAIHRISADAFTGYLSGKAPTEEMIAEAKQLGCGRLSVPVDQTTRLMARKIKEFGLQLSLYPMKTKDDADLAVLWGASIICTDTPSELVGTSVKP